MLISIDFDGTIVEHEFPKIGKPMPHAFRVMKALKRAGHKLILNTCREDHQSDTAENYLAQAIEFCKIRGVTFISHNENNIADDFRKHSLRRKVFYDVHIDDRNFDGFPGWLEVERIILKNGGK